MADYDCINDVTTITDTLGGWNPDAFRAYQLRDYLDFRAVFGSSYQSILRLMANRSAHLYGELVLHDGGVRSFETFGFTCVDEDQDIASFRSGAMAGTEKVRITQRGNIEAQGDLSADSALRGIGDSGFEVFARTMDGSHKSLTLQGSTLVFEAEGTSAVKQWGTIEFDALNAPNLKIHNGTGYDTLTIDGNRSIIKGQAGTGFLFKVEDASSTSRFEVAATGDEVSIHGHALTIDEDVDLSSLGGGNMCTVASQNAEAGPIVAHYFEVTTNSSTNYDISINDKIRIFDVIVIKRNATGTTSDSVTLKNGTLAITNAITFGLPFGGANAVGRASTIIAASSTVLGTLRLTTSWNNPSGDVRCEVIVLGVRTS
jgi:hypothetical protein